MLPQHPVNIKENERRALALLIIWKAGISAISNPKG